MFTIIPAKPFDEAKTRLAAALSPAQRAALARNLLHRTIQQARPAGQVVVISRDRAARRLAKQAGAWALVEAGDGLNGALRQALAWVMAQGDDTALILPADLPRLRPTDVAAMRRLAGPPPAVVLAPCHHNRGTNALLLSPPNLLPVSFGPHSYRRHLQAARAAGLEPVIYRSSTVAFDLDWPEDLIALRSHLAALS